jgi:DNA-binding transcriptional ArsR family regulator
MRSNEMHKEGGVSGEVSFSKCLFPRLGVTKHLTVLAEAGLVIDFKRGREGVWRLHKEQLEEARRFSTRFRSDGTTRSTGRRKCWRNEATSHKDCEFLLTDLHPCLIFVALTVTTIR